MPYSSNSMSEAELQQLVEQISLNYFQRPFLHQAKINRRMTTTGGRYHLDDHHLEINAHFLVPEYRQALIGIIKHELCHYHLHLLGLGYRHRNASFRTLLAKVGGSRYAPDIGLRRKKAFAYLYLCTNCGLKYPRKRRLNTSRYRCGKCAGKLKLIKKQK